MRMCLTCKKQACKSKYERYCSICCKLEYHVLKIGGCWLWQGSKTKDGYGQLTIDKKGVKTHRLSFELHHGKIRKHQRLYHICDEILCCAPSHVTDKMPIWHENYISPELTREIKQVIERKILKPREIRDIFDINPQQFREIKEVKYDAL